MKNYEPPTSPENMNESFAHAYNSGDVNNINALFEQGARVVRYNGDIVTGMENIHREHVNLLQFGGRMTSINKYCVEIDGVALLRADWKIETRNANGEEMTIEGASAEIVRKQPDGTWLYIVDNPFGANHQ